MPTLESATRFDTDTPFFDVVKSAREYHKIEAIHGAEIAKSRAERLFAGDFTSIGWEIAQLRTPFESTYRLIETKQGKKLVYLTDLEEEKDLLSCIDSRIRRGSELIAAENYKTAMINAQVGETVIWVSPKKERSETDEECPYPRTQLNLAEKTSANDFHFRQFQTEHLDTAQAATFLNLASRAQVLSPTSRLHEVITTVGTRKGRLETAQVQDLVNEIAGSAAIPETAGDRHILDNITRLSAVNARRLVEAIASGMTDDQLRALHKHLLADTLKQTYVKYSYQSTGGGGFTVKTSCGAFEIAGQKSSQQTSGERKTPGRCKLCGTVNYCTQDCYICHGELEDINRFL